LSTAALKPDSNELAMDRTWLAHERTLMAWVRTATSMISFGFTIYKFFQFESGKNTVVGHGLLTPRDFALIIVSIGQVSLLMAIVQHRKQLKELKPYFAERRVSLAEIMAVMISLFGILVLLSAILRS